jgi:hypothetical protein
LWEEFGHTPVVFVRVASKGLTGYGTWKSAQRIENKGFAKAVLTQESERRKIELIDGPPGLGLRIHERR